jgi:hypothetical protein
MMVKLVGSVVRSRMREELNLFNTPIETGARLSLLLSCLNGKSLDIEQLVFLDYVLIYSAEFSGPENLHPAVPNHFAEISHRRSLLPDALKLFLSRGLLSKKFSQKGIYYSANDETSQFVACLKSPYYKKMWKNLIWIDENYENLNGTYSSVINGFRK